MSSRVKYELGKYLPCFQTKYRVTRKYLSIRSSYVSFATSTLFYYCSSMNVIRKIPRFVKLDQFRLQVWETQPGMLLTNKGK